MIKYLEMGRYRRLVEVFDEKPVELDDEGTVLDDGEDVKRPPAKRAKKKKPPKTPPCPRKRKHNRPRRTMY